MKKTLTLKQELFAQEYAKCGNASASYKKAYPKALKWKDTAVWQAGSKTLALGHVSARVTELKNDLADRGLWTREQSVKILAEVALDMDTKGYEKVIAVKELNKMHGFEEPTVIDNISSDGSMSPAVTFSSFYDDIEDDEA